LTAAVYRPTGVITDGLSLREWVRRSPSTAYRITARRSIVQQALLQTVYRCGMGTAFPSTGYRIDGGTVYRSTGDITDGLSLRVWVRRSPSTGYRIVTIYGISARIIGIVFFLQNGTFQVIITM